MIWWILIIGTLIFYYSMFMTDHPGPPTPIAGLVLITPWFWLAIVLRLITNFLHIHRTGQE